MTGSDLAALSPPLSDIVSRAERAAKLKAARFHWNPVTGLASAIPAAARDPRPVNVAVIQGRKSLFGWIEDDRVTVRPANAPLAAPPELVVTPRLDQLAADLAGLPHDLGARLATGAAKLVIDACSEGMPHSPAVSDHIHGVLRSAGISPADCVYLTQDRRFRSDYLAHHCAPASGEPVMNVLVHDRFIQYLFAALRAGGPEAIFRHHLQTYAAAPRVRLRRFLSFNNKLVYPHRTLFLLRLLRDGLWDSGHISVGKLLEFDSHTVPRGKFLKRMFTRPELREPMHEVIPLLDRLEALSPTYIGIDEAGPKGGASKAMIVPRMLEEYSTSWFSVVVETDTLDRLFRITEKPFKPLLCFHPLIVLGSVGCLSLIREYGFQTFPGLFDESYDETADVRARFEQVYEQVVRLCRAPEPELARACEAADESVVFNACWGLTQLPRLFRDRIDSALIDHLIAFGHGENPRPGPA